MPPQEDERCGFVNVVRCANVAFRLYATSLNVCSCAAAVGEEQISQGGQALRSNRQCRICFVNLVLTFGGGNIVRRTERQHDEGPDLCGAPGLHGQSCRLCRSCRGPFQQLHRRRPSRRQLSAPCDLHLRAPRSAIRSVIDDRFARTANGQNCFDSGAANPLGTLVRR